MDLLIYSAYAARNICRLPLYKDHLIVSPETIHPGARFLRAQACGLTDDNLRNIGRFTNLRYLLLAGNGLGIESVKKIVQLTQLEVINLNFNKLNDQALLLLSKMPSLKALSVGINSMITDEGTINIPSNVVLEKLEIHLTSISHKRYQELQRSGLEIKYY